MPLTTVSGPEAGRCYFVCSGPFYITQDEGERKQRLQHFFDASVLAGWPGDVQTRVVRLEAERQVCCSLQLSDAHGKISS